MRSLRSIASISSSVIPASVAVPNIAVSEIDSGSCVPRSSRPSVAGSIPNTVSSMNRNGSRTVRCCSPSAGCATTKPPSPCPNPPFRSTKPKLLFRPGPALPFRPGLFHLFPQPHSDVPIDSLPMSENETAKAHLRIVFRFRPLAVHASSRPKSTPTSLRRRTRTPTWDNSSTAQADDSVSGERYAPSWTEIPTTSARQRESRARDLNNRRRGKQRRGIRIDSSPDRIV
ncbi:hypothetical protein B0J17DRAFT_448981 [Rhizoctonia solani]|nr:hypothetical protein B0J17DRAFT_448981 [Rhizoctonia solani]